MKSKVEIIPFEDHHAAIFRALNLDWISHYFKVEPQDLVMLDAPRAYIIDKGGYIFFARYNGLIVGTCAMIAYPDGSYELSKMAVKPDFRGLKLGWKLGEVIIEKTKALGAKHLWLESNTILTPAIRLYEKLGFKEVKDFESPYQRANIKMEMWLDG